MRGSILFKVCGFKVLRSQKFSRSLFCYLKYLTTEWIVLVLIFNSLATLLAGITVLVKFASEPWISTMMALLTLSGNFLLSVLGVTGFMGFGALTI